MKREIPSPSTRDVWEMSEQYQRSSTYETAKRDGEAFQYTRKLFIKVREGKEHIFGRRSHGLLVSLSLSLSLFFED